MPLSWSPRTVTFILTYKTFLHFWNHQGPFYVITLFSSSWTIPPRQNSVNGEWCEFGICLLLGFDQIYFWEWEIKDQTKCKSGADKLLLATTGQLQWVPGNALWHVDLTAQLQQYPSKHAHLLCHLHHWDVKHHCPQGCFLRSSSLQSNISLSNTICCCFSLSQSL